MLLGSILWYLSETQRLRPLKKLAVMLMFTLIAVPAAFAQTEIVRFTENCEFTVTFPGKISTRLKKGTTKSPQEWMHARDIDNLGKHYEISAMIADFLKSVRRK